MLPKDNLADMRDLIFKARNLKGRLDGLTDILELLVKDEEWQSDEMLEVALGEIKSIFHVMRDTNESFNKMEEVLSKILSKKYYTKR